MPKTDERGIPCHDKRDNYCPVCGWDCEDKPAMTDPRIGTFARKVTHEAALQAARNFIDQHFNNRDGKGVLTCIPARPDDDDVTLMDYIKQQQAEAHLRTPAGEAGEMDRVTLTGPTYPIIKCPECGGTGGSLDAVCSTCSGTGRMVSTEANHLSATDTEAMRLLLADLHSFMDVAASEGFICAGLDAADLFHRIDALAKDRGS